MQIGPAYPQRWLKGYFLGRVEYIPHGEKRIHIQRSHRIGSRLIDSVIGVDILIDLDIIRGQDAEFCSKG